jgi:hypothetical protein
MTFTYVLVPYRQARKDIRRAFRRAGRFLRVWDGNVPARWCCERCGETIETPELTLDYRSRPGLPVCPTMHCPGAGWEDIRPAA